MSAWEGSQSQCDLCDGVFGHKTACARYKPARTPQVKAAHSGLPRYRYKGRVYELAACARIPNGPCTLVSVDAPNEMIDTSTLMLNDTRIFEPV